MTEYGKQKEVPTILTVDRGFEVRINSRVSLPGYYTSYHRAEQAIQRYVGLMNQVKNKRK